jgi:phosphate transport system permease protein
VLRASPRLAVMVFGALLLAIVISLGTGAAPAIGHFGTGLLTGTVWDPQAVRLGALTFLVGTIETTALAMVVVVPIGLGCALFLVGFVRPRLRSMLSTAFELMAGVPSVVYGLWGLQVGAPFVRTILEPALHAALGSTGIAGGPDLGIGLLLGSLVLSMMVLPTMVAVTRDVLAAVPDDRVEGALALGATRWQALTRVALPAARTGVLGAATLAMGRAIGETVAITMVIGNNPAFAHSLFAPADTMTSVIASEFTAATEPFHASALVFIGVLLMLVSVIVNAGARLLVRATLRGSLVRQRVAAS